MNLIANSRLLLISMGQDYQTVLIVLFTLASTWEINPYNPESITDVIRSC